VATKKKPAKKTATAVYQPGMRFDLACGQNKQDGFIGIDVQKIDGVDMVFDLEEYPWPIEDDCAEELFCSHFVEHTRDLCAFMDEAWRICRDGATVTLVHPYYTSIRAWQDPTHLRAINEVTWYYFSREWREQQKLDHYPLQCDFTVEAITAFFNEPWNLKSEEAKTFAQQHYFNVISDLTVVLKAKKTN
jgi:hypothetical protein